MSAAAEAPAGRPARCLSCGHHHITYDRHFPYGCRAMGFKSRRLPEREVLEASGAPCLMFLPRRPPEPS